MAETGMSFREVVSNFSNQQKWKEVTINIGVSANPLCDVKFADSAGGYGYRDSHVMGNICRNRFIYWKTHHDVLELAEVSLDLNLTGNCILFRFQHAPLLEGITIQESHGHVIILVATVSSIHRLIFPHPQRLQKHGNDQTGISIFADLPLKLIHDPMNCHLIGQNGNLAPQSHAATSGLTSEGEALFAMATNTGSILLIRLPPIGQDGIITRHEMRQSSMMHRLWTGLVPAMIRGEGENSDITMSLTMHPLLGYDTFIFTVCRDHKLRMWSCQNQELVLVGDLLDYVPDGHDPSKIALGAEGHMIRKSLGSTPTSLYIGVYLSFADCCQFCVFNPIFADGRYQLNHVTTVFGPNEDLIDFCVTSTHIWTLWADSEGESAVRYSSYAINGPNPENWSKAIMEAPGASGIDVPIHIDPRQAYMQNIFAPGRFSSKAILKAINIYRRSVDATSMPDSNISLETLKQAVSSIVEGEIQKEAGEYELVEEEYHHLQIVQWSKFYSCCIQYQQVGLKPIGLFADNNTGMVSIVKKNSLSFLRQCGSIEHLYLTPSAYCISNDFEDEPILAEDELLCNDVIQLCDCVKETGDQLNSGMIYVFEHDLYHLGNPSAIAQELVKAMLNDTSDNTSNQVMRDILHKLQNIKDIIKATDAVLQLLDLAQGRPDEMILNQPDTDATRQLNCSNLFHSNVAVELLSKTMTQLVDTCLDFSRDLLVLQTVLVNVGKQTVTEEFKSDLIPKTSLLVQSYYVMRWVSQSPAIRPLPGVVESVNRQLSALEMTDTSTFKANSLFDSQQVSLPELFLYGIGGTLLRGLLAANTLFDESVGVASLWVTALLPAVNILSKFLWPISGNFMLAEFLMSHCQFTAVQEYVRLTHSWCQWNASSRKFVLGLAYLNSSEPHKAVDCFLEAVHGVDSEDLLRNKVLKAGKTRCKNLEVHYYIKIMRLFEQFSLPDLVINLADTAISMADEHDENIPMLWSKIFKYHLELGHNEEAYSTMIANPDPSRRKDCLRQFIVVLCERRQLKALVQFPYIDLHDDVVSIIESRARSVDLATHNYYDLLYAFHVFRGNFRKAGSVMYEYGMRLGHELPGLEGLQRKAKCYLAAMNALSLVKPEYAWIVKPVSVSTADKKLSQKSSASKRSSSGDEIMPFNRKVDVLELCDIEKEYVLVSARLKLIQREPDPTHMTGPTPSAEETVALLVNDGLFDLALDICRLFKLPFITLFEGLASRCVKLSQMSNYHMRGDNDYTSDAWDWLTENNIGSVNRHKEITSADQAWRLLQVYLEKYEDSTSQHHKCVAMRLLSQDFPLPSWFIASYKKINAAELLRLYLYYDQLEDAAILTMEYIDAVLGCGMEHFGIKNPVHYSAPSVWLPYTSIDELLLALQGADMDTEYGKLHMNLQDKLDHYFNTIGRASQDRLDAAVAAKRLV